MSSAISDRTERVVEASSAGLGKTVARRAALLEV